MSSLPFGTALAVTLVTEGRGPDPGLLRRVGAAVEAGLDFVQVRERQLADGALRRLVADVVERAGAARVLVNGRPDVALVTGAAGVQLPEAGAPVRAVRRAFPALIIGASCHSVDAVRRAEDEGADFALLGPIFATPGKEERTLGTATLAAAVRAVAIPVHAVGGIEPANARRVMAAGARGVAGIRVFRDDAAAAVAALRRETRERRRSAR